MADSPKRRLKIIKFEIETSPGTTVDLTSYIKSLSINDEIFEISDPIDEAMLAALDAYYLSLTDRLLSNKK